MASSTTNAFGAGDSALGYLYQVRLALLHSLTRLKNGSDFLVSIEVLDDVAFKQPENPQRSSKRNNTLVEGRT